MVANQVEIYYGLHGGEPILIGAGSFEDVDRVHQEAEGLNTNHKTPSTDVMSPGARHFYRSLGEIAGVVSVTDAALDHYTALVEESRTGYIKKLAAEE
ncbi:MAG: hypothetical protein V4702_00825 [Patescibacteria group bacterium]